MRINKRMLRPIYIDLNISIQVDRSYTFMPSETSYWSGNLINHSSFYAEIHQTSLSAVKIWIYEHDYKLECECFVHASTLIWHAKSGLYAFSVHTKNGFLTKSGHTLCPLLILTSVLDFYPWKPRNWPQNYGGSLSLLLALKLFLELFYTGMKVCSWLKLHTFQSALHMLSVDHLNINGSPFPVKCVRKFGSALDGEVTFRCVCVCACALT